MKRKVRLIAALMFTVCFMLLAVASGSSDKPSKSTGSDATGQSNAAESKDEVFKLNETAVFSKLKVTATEVKVSNGTNQFSMPKAGNVFVGVKFSIENISAETEALSSLLLFTAYADNIKLETQFITDDTFTGTLDGELAAGKKMVGFYTMEVPKSTKKIDLDFSASWLSGSKATFSIDMPAT